MCEASAKSYALLVWGLLECLLFSGVVYGWGYLVQILTHDGYFAELCNDTDMIMQSSVRINSENNVVDIAANLNYQKNWTVLGNDTRIMTADLTSKLITLNPSTISGHKYASMPFTKYQSDQSNGVDVSETSAFRQRLPQYPLISPKARQWSTRSLKHNPSISQRTREVRTSESLTKTSSRYFYIGQSSVQISDHKQAYVAQPLRQKSHHRQPYVTQPTRVKYQSTAKQSVMTVTHLPVRNVHNVQSDDSQPLSANYQPATQTSRHRTPKVAPPLPQVSHPRQSAFVQPVAQKGPDDNLKASQLITDFGNVTTCRGQEDMFLMFVSVAYLCRGVLVMLVGVFYDMYGTMRARFIAVLFVIVGTLLMTFTTPGLPWLMIPALSLLGLSGVVILATNLQAANLFGPRRYTLVSMYVGAHESGSLIAYLMTLSYQDGINMQTSFMFLTISIVPLLVSTIALLPKIRIPWPLPANYGKRRGTQIDELSLKHQIAWKRQGGAGTRGQDDERSCLTIVSQSLIMCCVVWYAVHTSLATFITNNVADNVRAMSASNSLAKEYASYSQVLQFAGVALSPLLGVIMDRRASSHSDANVAQMQNVAVGVTLTNIVSVLTAALNVVPVVPLQMGVMVMAVGVRVFGHSATVAFLMHINFPQEMFGRLYGSMMVVHSLVMAAQYPIRLVLTSHLHQNPLIISVAHIVLLTAVMIHPANLWRHCKRGMLRDRSGFEMERRRKSSCGDATHVQRHLIQRRPTECKTSNNTLDVVDNGLQARRHSDLSVAESPEPLSMLVVPPSDSPNLGRYVVDDSV